MSKRIGIDEVVIYQEGPGVRKSQYKAEGIKLLNVANLKDGKLDLSTSERYISYEEGNGKYKHFLVDEGDFIIASSGIKVEYFHKKMGFATEEHLPLCMNTSTIRFKPKVNQFNMKYFMYFMKSNDFKKQLNKQIVGSAQLNFGPSHLKKMDMIVYDKETQNKIANELDTITKLIEKRKQQLDKLDLLVKAKFIEMFGDPVENPMGWETVKVEDICKNIMGGGTPKKSVIKYYTGEIPWVTPKDMKVKYIEDSIDKITPKAIDNSSAKLIPRNSLLMVIRSGILKRTLPLAINIKEVTINQDMKALITNDKMKSIVLYYMIKLQEKRILNNVRAVTADNIEFSVIKNMLILNPPISMQEEFSDFVYKCDKMKANIVKQMQLQQTLYKSKMQKYFG